MTFRFSLRSLLQFLLGLQLFCAVNYFAYASSRGGMGECAGWPLMFYARWNTIVPVRYWSPLRLAADIVVGLLVATVFARFRWQVMMAQLSRARLWGMPEDISANEDPRS